MAIISRIREVGWSVESSHARDTTLSNLYANDVTNAFDVSFTYDFDEHPRIRAASLSNDASVTGQLRAQIGFSNHLKGSGAATTAPAWNTLLEACGWTESVGTADVDYTLSSASDIDTLTMGVFMDGKVKEISGALGNLVLSADVGAPGVMAWTFSGVWYQETAEAIPAFTYDSTIPPAFKNGTFTVGGSAFQVSSFSLDLGNDIAIRPDPNETEGATYAVRTNRRPTITFNTEEGVSDTIIAAWTASTTAALSLIFGTSAGNIITIAAPALQYIGVSEGDRDGITIRDLTGLCTQSAAANDELTISTS